ncbi:CapA family protein, partial [Clostridioides difficile]|uniref:CapA family protein n=1 Tax=Clostridioides difficile TaxID=1496 RepID=UPI0023510296
KSLKKKSDVVVVYFHWGIELDYYPDKKQKDFAHYAIDKGADLDKPEAYRKKARIQFTPSVQSGNDVLQIRDVSMGYGERILFK